MNTTTQRRGLLAGAGALLTAAALAFGGATAANAAPAQPVPTQSTVTITKLEQPASLGSAATGQQLDTLPSVGINGVVFDYYLVTGTGVGQPNDIGTNAGQAYAAGRTAASAPIAANATGSFGATAGSGVTTATLPRGLYVVKESVTPAGVTPAGDFLLSVPLTNPTNRDAWLDTIYVYPKNAKSGASKTVNNAGDLVVGSNVDWTISADIPRNANPAGGTPAFVAPDAFRVVDTLKNDELALVGTPVLVAGTTALVAADFGITTDTSVAGSTSYTINLTASGLAKLGTAINADPNAKLSVTLTTTVKKAADISNSANVFPSQSAISANKPIVTDPVSAKYGSYQIVKDSSDDAVTDLSGAQFRVYRTEAAAQAGGSDYLSPTDNAGTPQSLWTTDASGKVTIQGLRYSAFADGVVLASSDARYQTYWLVEVKALPGHQLLTQPVEITIGDGSVAQTSQVIVNQKTTGGFVLPLTGGMGTTFLTVGGIALLALVLLFVARRRRHDATVQAAAE